MHNATDAMTVEPLRAQHIEAVASMLARAMLDDPAFAYLFPSLAQRQAGLGDFFARNLRTHLPYRCSYVALDRGARVLGTVTIRPPGGVPISLLTMLRRGLLPFAARHGTAAVRRLLWLKDRYDAFEREAGDHAPHAYVHMMAVEPAQQGRGHGRVLLQRALAESEAPRAAQTVLTTHKPRNVTFYRRAGFEVCSEREVSPPGSTPYTAWLMRKPS